MPGWDRAQAVGARQPARRSGALLLPSCPGVGRGCLGGTTG